MAQKPLPEDFRDFIESLNSNEVEYILLFRQLNISHSMLRN